MPPILVFSPDCFDGFFTVEDLFRCLLYKIDGTFNATFNRDFLINGSMLSVHIVRLSCDFFWKLTKFHQQAITFPPRYLFDFDSESRLGRGAFGKVYKVRHKLDGCFYAIKRIQFKNVDDLVNCEHEVKIHSHLHHPNIARYYQAWMEIESDGTHPPSSTTSSEGSSDGSFKQSINSGSNESDSHCSDIFQRQGGSNGTNASSSSRKCVNEMALVRSPISPNRSWTFVQPFESAVICIQMEYCSNNLSQWLETRNKELTHLSLEDQHLAHQLFYETVEGVRYLHSNNIIHCDLKPSNILLLDESGKLTVKLCDFGLSRFRMKQNLECNPDDGTCAYLAPELLENVKVPLNEKRDMYALGVILLELMYCFHTRTELWKMLRGQDKIPTTGPKAIPSIVTKVIHELIDGLPEQRPSCDTVLSSGIFSVLQSVTATYELLLEKDREINKLKKRIKELEAIR